MSRNHNIAQTRVHPETKRAMLLEAKAANLSPSALLRRWITEKLRAAGWRDLETPES